MLFLVIIIVCVVSIFSVVLFGLLLDYLVDLIWLVVNDDCVVLAVLIEFVVVVIGVGIVIVFYLVLRRYGCVLVFGVVVV